MTKSNTYEIDILNLLLCGISITDIAIASTVQTLIWASLHTADPGETGTQGTSEATYAGYARTSIARSTAGFAVSTSSGAASPVAAIAFPQATSTSTSTQTFAAFGASSNSTGGKIFYKGAISPTIAIVQNTIPRLTTGSSITED
jgi:hypothetical protein